MTMSDRYAVFRIERDHPLFTLLADYLRIKDANWKAIDAILAEYGWGKDNADAYLHGGTLRFSCLQTIPGLPRDTWRTSKGKAYLKATGKGKELRERLDAACETPGIDPSEAYHHFGTTWYVGDGMYIEQIQMTYTHKGLKLLLAYLHVPFRDLEVVFAKYPELRGKDVTALQMHEDAERIKKTEEK
jgi:hypothetical protein